MLEEMRNEDWEGFNKELINAKNKKDIMEAFTNFPEVLLEMSGCPPFAEDTGSSIEADLV